MSKCELFEELASPNSEGISRWVYCEEFTGRYDILYTGGNGLGWGRKGSTLDKKYYIEKKRKGDVKNGKIEAIKLNGFKEEDIFSQSIRKDIIDYHKDSPCAMSGLTIDIEIDHKNGRKDDEKVMKLENQEIGDFQPLNRNINLLKRQKCRRCKETGKRFDARELGFNIGWTVGKEEYEEEIGCNGCFWFDPIDFRRSL